MHINHQWGKKNQWKLWAVHSNTGLNFQTRKQYRCMNWNIREITDGKLHLNNMTREDRLNLKKSWKPLIQKKHKKYTSTLFSTVHWTWKRPSWSISHWPKVAPPPTSLTLINIPLPLPWLWSTIFNASLGLILSTFLTLWAMSFLFYYYLTLLLKHYECKDVSTSNQ